jgi:tetratricopeptide (TPR) repeat protein
MRAAAISGAGPSTFRPRPCTNACWPSGKRPWAPDHALTGTSLNGLGHVLHDLGDLDEARRHHLRALAIHEVQLGPDHPDVARSLDHLGAVLANMGDLPAARAHHNRALAIREARLGRDHPQTALSL